jgi:hypothetical protein
VLSNETARRWLIKVLYRYYVMTLIFLKIVTTEFPLKNSINYKCKACSFVLFPQQFYSSKRQLNW